SKERLSTCPRHNDQSPTLSVNPAKDVFNCPACNAGGNSWKFAAFNAGASPEDKPAVSRWLREHGLSNGTASHDPTELPSTYRNHPIARWYDYQGYAVARVEHFKDGKRLKEFP